MAGRWTVARLTKSVVLEWLWILPVALCLLMLLVPPWNIHLGNVNIHRGYVFSDDVDKTPYTIMEDRGAGYVMDWGYQYSKPTWQEMSSRLPHALAVSDGDGGLMYEAWPVFDEGLVSARRNWERLMKQIAAVVVAYYLIRRLLRKPDVVYPEVYPGHQGMIDGDFGHLHQVEDEDASDSQKPNGP